jgi:FkbM family methyltransferase
MNAEHITAQLLLRLWPFPRGAGRLIDRFFSNVTFGQKITSVRTTDGFTMKVLPNDLVGRHLYLTGEFDRSNVEILINFSEAGDVLLDVGANLGYVSGCFLRNVSGSRVLAVEPQPVVLDLLRENLGQFGDRQIVFPFALSNKDGEAWFDIDSANNGASHLTDNRSASTIRVELKSAHRFFGEINEPKLDLVKIDVEGHEEEVFNSCKQTFAKLQPRAIVFEEQADKCAPNKVIGKLLNEIGYNVFGIEKKLTRLNLLPIRYDDDCRHNDYIAVSRIRALPSLAKTIYKL